MDDDEVADRMERLLCRRFEVGDRVTAKPDALPPYQLGPGPLPSYARGTVISCHPDVKIPGCVRVLWDNGNEFSVSPSKLMLEEES